MHSQELLVEAIRRRLNGEPIKGIARELDVSVGWASENLSGIRPRPAATRGLQSASQKELEDDALKWGHARAVAWSLLNSHKQAQRESSLTVLREATEQFSKLPEPETPAYAQLDRLQQLFAKSPDGGVFGLVQVKAPRLHEHLLGWVRERHAKTQDKSDDRFVEMAQATRDHVVNTLTPPSHASQCVNELAAARWLGRWVANARGRGERRRNLARARLMLEIADIVDGLRSKSRVLHDPAVKAVMDGRWAQLFDELIATKNSYQYEC